MPLKFTLQQTLDSEKITKYQLAKESGIRPNTISEICAGQSARLSVQTLDEILLTLNRLTGKQYGLDAIIVYSEPTDAN